MPIILFGTIEPNVGIVSVPDERLARIEAVIATQKVIPAIVEIVDIAGLVRGASQVRAGQPVLGSYSQCRWCQHVRWCFDNDDITHVDDSIDPIRDIDTIDTELVLADLESMERQLRANKKARGGDKEAKERLNSWSRRRHCWKRVSSTYR